MKLQVLDVRSLRGEHRVNVRMTWSRGFLWWKWECTETYTFLTPDGITWREYDVDWKGVGTNRAACRVDPELEDGLWRALDAYQRRQELEI